MAEEPNPIIRNCAQCGVDFAQPSGAPEKMYCTRRCNVAAWRARNPDRNQEHRAKERAKADCVRKCLECGGAVDRRKRLCRSCLVGRKRAQQRLWYSRAASLAPVRKCMDCDALLPPAKWQRRCEPCKMARLRHLTPHQNAVKRLHRYRKRAATVEPVDPIKVFDRDGWRCHMCRRPTPRHLRGTYEPRAPELEHIVPLSKGGEHSYRNTACSCRECNLKKGDKVFGQLHLGV